MFNDWHSDRRTGQALAGKSPVGTERVGQGLGGTLCAPTPQTRSFELNEGFTLTLSFCYPAQELFPPDRGEGEAPEEEKRRAGSDRQAPGGESAETPGGKPESGEYLSLLGAGLESITRTSPLLLLLS